MKSAGRQEMREALHCLPPDLVSDVVDEIFGFAARGRAEESCIVTGSLIEGIGNRNSDIDLYVIRPGERNLQGTAIGMRKLRYLDCEYMTEAAVADLAARVAGADWPALIELNIADIDRYYRLAIGLPVALSAAVGRALGLFGKDESCQVFARWALCRAYEYLARAGLVYAAGSVQRSVMLLREAALWRANSVLAAAGEGYPSLKWTMIKAARRFGRGSPAFEECLDGCLRLAVDPADELSRLRAAISLPEPALAAITGKSFSLDGEARMLAGAGKHYVIRGKAMIAEVAGPVADICEYLDAGASWDESVARIAAKMSLPPGEAAVAMQFYVKDLYAAGCLAAVVQVSEPSCG